jgi:hypothetical protein
MLEEPRNPVIMKLENDEMFQGLRLEADTHKLYCQKAYKEYGQQPWP